MIQNGLLVISSVVMAVMFYFDLNVCSNVLVFCLLTVVIILLTSGANLATVANTISIEKDWIVVIADGNEDTLAGKIETLFHDYNSGAHFDEQSSFPPKVSLLMDMSWYYILCHTINSKLVVNMEIYV